MNLLSGNWELFLFNIFARFIVLMTAMPLHECAHAWVADKLGDDTARTNGRLNLNPFVHLDPIGTVMILLFGFGWAKPVMVNPTKFKNRRGGMALTALAGPVSNLLISTVTLIIYKVLYLLLLFGVLSGGNATSAVFLVLEIMIVTNISIAIFNFLPIPPLDGSKIIGFFLPYKWEFKMLQYQRQISAVLMILVVVGLLDIPMNFLSNLVFNGLNYITDFVYWIVELFV